MNNFFRETSHQDILSSIRISINIRSRGTMYEHRIFCVLLRSGVLELERLSLNSVQGTVLGSPSTAFLSRRVFVDLGPLWRPTSTVFLYQKVFFDLGPFSDPPSTVSRPEGLTRAWLISLPWPLDGLDKPDGLGCLTRQWVLTRLKGDFWGDLGSRSTHWRSQVNVAGDSWRPE